MCGRKKPITYFGRNPPIFKAILYIHLTMELWITAKVLCMLLNHILILQIIESNASVWIHVGPRKFSDLKNCHREKEILKNIREERTSGLSKFAQRRRVAFLISSSWFLEAPEIGERPWVCACTHCKRVWSAAAAAGFFKFTLFSSSFYLFFFFFFLLLVRATRVFLQIASSHFFADTMFDFFFRSHV